MSTYQIISLTVGGFTSTLALLIAFYQMRINKKLATLQDRVSLSLVGELRDDNFIVKFINSGNVDLFLHDGETRIPEKDKEELGSLDLSRPHLIPADTTTTFQIIEKNELPINKEIWAKLFLSDSLERKWESEHGAIYDGEELRVWTYEINQRNWNR